MNKKLFKLSLQDSLCLRFLWKWKLLSTSALRSAVYRERSFEGTYKRLNKLENARLIKAHRSESGNSSLWHLDDFGFKIIQPSMPYLKEKGYKSENKEHDFWVTAIHLGEWVHYMPQGCDVFTEQELRRNEFDGYPDWVPKTIDHRPDGWWKIFNPRTEKINLIALEVELNRKTSLAYENIGEFYSNQGCACEVIWVVRRKSDLNFIHKNIANGSSSVAQEQSYLTLDQFMQTHWQSQVLSGKRQGQTLSEILETSPGQCLPKSESLVLLDTRKKPIKSTLPPKIEFLEEGVSHTYMF